MSWANCGTDSKGRSIGYAHEATCDHPGCDEKIDRGLAYTCGGMHGENEGDCEGYFCDKHLFSVEDPDERFHSARLCEACKHKWNEHLVEDLIEQVKELERVDWQPLKTAPRDGSLVLIDMGDATPLPTMGRWTGEGPYPWQFIDADSTLMRVNRCKEESIRGWMPIPARPTNRPISDLPR